MTGRADHPSLRSPDLELVWSAARERLDRFGADRRGSITLGPLTSGAELILESLLGRRPGKTIDLELLEGRLSRLGVGFDLDSALDALGFPPSVERSRNRSKRRSALATRELIRTEVAGWAEPWAVAWVDDLIRAGSTAGLDSEDSLRLVGDVRRLLDYLQGGRGSGADFPLVVNNAGIASRTDLAARLFGNAHALDSGTLLERVSRRALGCSLGFTDRSTMEPSDDTRIEEDQAAVWESAGFHLDLVSSPIVSWGLDLVSPPDLAALAEAATAVGLPFVITSLALRDVTIRSRPGARILVAENPRVVEAAAEKRVPFGVVTTNGNPRRNVVSLVSDLVASETSVHYHGDFDSPGLAICRRMAELGCTPFDMSEAAYLRACRRAGDLGVSLPTDAGPCGPTPWDPALETVFEREGKAVHEEFMLASLLADFAAVG